MRTIHAVFLCDSRADCDRLAAALEEHGLSVALEHVKTVEEVFELPESDKYDCMLCAAGTGALRAIRTVRESALSLPIIYLGNGGSEEALVEAQHRGAYDVFDLSRDVAVYARLGRALLRLHSHCRGDAGTAHLLERRREEFLHLDNAVLITGIDDSTILDLNDAAEKLYGYTRKELTGRKTSVLYAYQSDYLDMSRRFIESMQESGVFAGRSFGRNRSGEIFPVFMHGFKVAGPHEGAPAVALLVRRVSEESAREVNLSEEILKKINNVVLVANRAGAIVYASPSVKQVLGYEPEELLDDGWWRLTREDPEQAEKERESVAEFARGDILSTEPYENHLQRKDGEHRWILWCDSRAASNHVIGVGTDITERKLAELELRRSRDELSEQTMRLTNVNRELDAFAYSVSHDLKSPLHRIASYAELLRENSRGRLNEKDQSFIERISSNCDQMSDLIGNLLEFSRTSRSEIIREPVDLSRIADQIAEHLRLESPERNIHFQIEVGLHGDADQSMMRVLLENLLRNAVKFTDGRDPAEIEFNCVEEGEGDRTFIVRDNGVGFDPRQVDRLFVPFSRLHSNERFAGTGLGLSIVRRIVERHGGRVWGEGSVEGGATFYFTLD